MKNLATSKMPIRASLLPNLFQCPSFFVDKLMNDGLEPGGDAAQTGSIVHAGIAHWEQHGNIALAMSTMQIEHKKNFPTGDLAEAGRLFNKYVERSKSDRKGKTEFIEKKIEFEFPYSEIDTTKEPLVITGTVDLVKSLTDRYYIIDHKSGRMYGDEMVKGYAPQLAAYTYGAWATLLKRTDKPIEGYITRLQDLARRDLPFYWKTIPSLERAKQILEMVAVEIALLRMGIKKNTPGKFCDWCGMAEFASSPSCMDGAKRIPLQLATGKKADNTKSNNSLGSMAAIFKRGKTDGSSK